MLENWLKKKTLSGHYNLNDLGNRFSTENIAQDTTQSLFILSDNSQYAKQSIEALLRLKDHFPNVGLHYLGILKNENQEFAIPLLQETLNLSGKVVLLSQHNKYFNALFRTLESKSNDVHLGCINHNLDDLDSHRDGFLKSKNLYNISFLGYQRHYCSLEQLDFLSNAFINHLSYGQINQSIDKVEPIVRSIQALIFSLSVCKHGTYHHQSLINPNGLDALEACQIAKYCGMSHDLRLINFSNSEGEVSNAHLTAECIWYLMEGMALGEPHPTKNKTLDFQEHLVRSDFLHKSLRFIRSIKSNRWWFAVPGDTNEIADNLYPCSFEDYKLATQNELSDFILDQINHDH